MPADFLDASLRLVVQGATFEQFAASLGRELPAIASETPAQRRAREMAIAREIWRVLPDPQKGWQLRRLDKPGRNESCPCGSGQKYKRCCEPLEPGAPPFALSPQDMAGLLFAHGLPAWREPEALRAMPPLMLGAAAHAWGEAHGDAAVAALLEPVFLDPAGLSDQHGAAFDLLLDALLSAGAEKRRERICQVVADKAASRALRCSAWSRLASMAADRGDAAGSWTAFRAAQRIDPANPQLWHLELTLLHAEDRRDEAKLRAPLLAARARREGLDELAGMLLLLGEEGLGAAVGEGTDSEQQAWIALLREPLQHLQAPDFRRMHTVVHDGADLIVTLPTRTKRLLKPWLARFSAAEPTLTQLDADADELLDDPEAARTWLQAHPEACCTLPVLDDLLIAARQMAGESGNVAVARAGAELARAAAAMVVEAFDSWPDACIHWAVMENRPLLRVVSHGVVAALHERDEQGAVAGMRWMLRRNPADNHGWREGLRERLLDAGDAAGALDVLRAYPDDAPPAEHDHALALFMAGERQQAETVLRGAHAAFPAFVQALLPERLDQPAAEAPGFVAVGGPEHAWGWRGGVRKAWVRSGALDWLRRLDLKDPPPVKARKPRKSAAERPGKPARKPLAAMGDARVLSAAYGERLPRLLGWIAALAWAPAMTMPTAWIGDALAGLPTPPDAGGVQQVASAIIDRYNRFNDQRLAAGSRASLPEDVAADDEAWIAFAAGFVEAAEKHGRIAWKPVGSVSPRNPLFAPLYQLAARAAPGADGWRASTDGGAPLLAAVGDTEPARKLLEQALQPLWREALAKRR